MKMHSESDNLTTAQACEILGKDRATLTRWVDRGLITPAFKMPGRTGGFVFTRADIERLAATEREKADIEAGA